MYKLNKQVGNHPADTQVTPTVHIMGCPHVTVVFHDTNTQGNVQIDDIDMIPDITLEQHEEAIDVALQEAGVKILPDPQDPQDPLADPALNPETDR